MPIVVRFASGGEAGRELSFEDAQGLVRFGRGSDCEVQFPADLDVVSRDHFALRHELGGWKFVINAEKPVAMNGRPVFDDQELPQAADVQISPPSGPKLRIIRTSVADGNMPKTRVLRPQETVVDAVAKARAGQRRSGALIAGVAAAVVAVAAVGYAGWRATTGEVEATKAGVAQTQTQIAETKAAVAETKSAVAALQQDLPAIKEQVGAALRAVDFSGVIAANKLSVWQVTIKSPNGEVMSTGTAWTVEVPGKGKALATNAHVAEIFDELKEQGGGDTLIAIQPNPAAGFPQVKIESVELHPGYAAFSKVVEEIAAKANAGVGRWVNLGAGYDAALMFVDRPDLLGPPMKFASQEKLEGLKSGEPVVSIGFPSEQVTGTFDLKPATTDHSGMVTASTTFFLTPSADASENQLIQMSVPVTGGASGSPLFDADGEVVGIVNAANFLFLDTNGDGQVDQNDVRIPSAIQVNFAQRADIVRELIEGRAAERVKTVYAELWKRAGEELTKPLSAIVAGFLSEFAAYTTGPDAIVLDSETEGLMDRPQKSIGDVRGAVFELQAKSGRNYLLVAFTADQRPVRIAVMEKTDNPEVAGGTAGGYVSAFLIQSQTDATYLVAPFEDWLTFPDAPRDRPPGKVTLRIYSGPRRPGNDPGPRRGSDRRARRPSASVDAGARDRPRRARAQRRDDGRAREGEGAGAPASCQDAQVGPCRAAPARRGRGRDLRRQARRGRGPGGRRDRRSPDHISDRRAARARPALGPERAARGPDRRRRRSRDGRAAGRRRAGERQAAQASRRSRRRPAPDGRPPGRRRGRARAGRGRRGRVAVRGPASLRGPGPAYPRRGGAAREVPCRARSYGRDPGRADREGPRAVDPLGRRHGHVRRRRRGRRPDRAAMRLLRLHGPRV